MSTGSWQSSRCVTLWGRSCFLSRLMMTSGGTGVDLSDVVSVKKTMNIVGMINDHVVTK